MLKVTHWDDSAFSVKFNKIFPLKTKPFESLGLTLSCYCDPNVKSDDYYVILLMINDTLAV